MAVIRVKRNGTAAGSLMSGELAVSSNNLYFGPFVNGDSPASAVKLANQNSENIFTNTNTFRVQQGAGFAFQNAAGNLTQKYFVNADGYLRTDIPIGNLTGTMLVNADYVNEKLQGLDVKASVVAASTSNIPGSYTTTNGGTFTFTSTGVWEPDGVTVALNDRVLIKNQTDNKNNGIYKIITLGASGVATVLQRTDDANSLLELSSAFVFVENGNTFADTGWTCTVGSTTTVPPAIDAVIPWTQFSGAGTYKADETSLHLNGNTFEIKSGAVTPGAFTVGGQLTVGTPGETWSIDGSAVDKMIFTRGSYTATLPQPTATRHTIAYTTDIPAGVNVVQCSTPTATAAKVVDVDNFSPADGKQLYIDFDNANTAAATFSATNGTNPLSLYLGPDGTANPTWGAGEVLRIEYRQGTPSAWYILENLTTGQYYGNAATASVATKLGTSTVGSSTRPIYLNGGTPTAITAVGVGYGGTGTTAAPTSGGVIYASSTTAYASTPLGTVGKILRSNGTIPEWSTPAFPNTAPSAGKFMVGDGTNWIESTSTIPGNAGAANSGKYLTVNGSGNYVISAYTLSLGSNTTINAAAGAGYAAYYSATGTLSGEQYLSVSRGGTGAGTFATNAILIGNGTSAISAPGPTLNATTMTFGGAGTIISAAASAMTITAGTTGKLTLNSGTTGGIDIGTGANAKTITIGNTTTGTAINLTSPLTTVSGELNVGTGGGSWSMDGLAPNKLQFKYGTQVYELPNTKAAGTYVLATINDVPEAVKTVDVGTATSAAHYLSFVDSNNGSATTENLYTRATLSFIPSTGQLSATEFVGLIDGGVWA